MSIRRSAPDDVAAIKNCVSVVLSATYGGLWTSELLVVRDQDWTQAWIACAEDRIVGVGLSTGDVVSDLWVSPETQGEGVGSALLAALEQEIATRGYGVARLRCLEPNLRSRAFYAGRGWAEVRNLPTRDHPAKHGGHGKAGPRCSIALSCPIVGPRLRDHSLESVRQCANLGSVRESRQRSQHV